MIRLILLFLSSISFSLSAQMINNGMANLFTETPFFNEKYIRSVNLKSIIGTISSKKELGAIKKSGKKEAYIFNKKGNLIIHYLSNNTKSKTDTVFTFYEYNKENKNSVMRVSDSYGFYSYTKNYDSTSRLVNQVYSREKNASKSKMNFKLEDDGTITDMFCMFANLTDDIESGWGKKTSLTANFVSLRVLSEDIDNFDVGSFSVDWILIFHDQKVEAHSKNMNVFDVGSSSIDWILILPS